MAQYEQKTDSREFEVANPDQKMGIGDSGGYSPADASDIAIRLWGLAPPDRRGPLTWKTESVLVYMIADLVTASRGRIAEEWSAVLAAHFDSCRQALVAAKRIQAAILEFLACRPGERIGGAILIYQPRTADPTGPSGEVVQLELGQAKPGQILLAENISRRLRDLPGLEFVAASSGVGGDVPPGLTELVWTTADRIALMRDSVGDGSEPIVAEAPPMGATLIVNSPIVNSPIMDSPFSRRGPPNDTTPPAVRAQDDVVKDGLGKDRLEKDHSETGSPRLSQVTLKASSPLTEELELGAGTLFTRTRVILGVVAVVLVGVLVAVLFRPTQASKPTTPQPQEQTAGSATGSTEQKTPTADEPQTKTAQPEPETVKPAAKIPAAVTKPPADNRAKNKKETKDASEPPPVVEESGGLSRGDIPGLLGMALKDTGDGEYEKARREYKKVLSLDPRNQQAIDGIIKLDKIQRDQQ